MAIRPRTSAWPAASEQGQDEMAAAITLETRTNLPQAERTPQDQRKKRKHSPPVREQDATLPSRQKLKGTLRKSRALKAR